MSTKEEINKDAQEYPGVAVDIADDNKVTDCLEKQYTKELNNNPRNTDDKI